MKNKKNKAHQIYRLANGDIVKGVTTIIGDNLGWNKNILIGWARKVALQGIDPNKVRDSAANVGTIVHYLIECHLKKITPDLNVYAPDEIDIAETAFIAYLDWEKRHNVIPLHLEISLVSEKYNYGGTIDFIGNVDNIMVKVDFKSGINVYPEDKIQSAAYTQLVEEKLGIKIPTYILHLGKTDGSFTPHYLPDLDNWWRVFKNLLEIDKIKNLLLEKKKK